MTVNKTVADALALQYADIASAMRSTAPYNEASSVAPGDPPAPPPTATGLDLAYGTDLSCTTALDPGLAEVDPASPSAIVEALIRRFITPRGGLLDDPNYGYDVRAWLNRGATSSSLQSLAGAMQAEARKDDRVLDVEIMITTDVNLPLSIRVVVTPVEPDLEPFEFTFTVTATGALLSEAI